jgi:hypothetical protein
MSFCSSGYPESLTHDNLSEVTHPDVMVMADALLPSVLGSGHGLEEACDLRVLAREAALRLERAAAGVTAWPRTGVGRMWWCMR